MFVEIIANQTKMYSFSDNVCRVPIWDVDKWWQWNVEAWAECQYSIVDGEIDQWRKKTESMCGRFSDTM